MATAKAEVKSLRNRLPENSSLEDVQYHLYVIEKVSKGLARAETEGAVSQEAAERNLNKWIAR